MILLKFLAFGALIIWSTSCNNYKQKTISRISGNDSSILNNKMIDEKIVSFAKEVYRKDSVRLFKIFIEGKPKSTRMTVIPTKKLYDSKSEYPFAIKHQSKITYMLYTGAEIYSIPSNELIRQFNNIKQNLPQSSSVYDAPILQFDVFSPSDIRQVIPPVSIFENQSEASKIDFRPPSR